MAVMRFKNPITGEWIVCNVNGKNGKDGITPHVGENKNWYIGDVDTGICAEGNHDCDTTPDIHIGDSEPTGDETIWIDTDDNGQDLKIPTKISELTNDAGYIKDSDVEGILSDGVYELIDTVTLEEDVKNLSITKEPDGTLYNFKAIMVKMTKPSTAGKYILQCYTYHKLIDIGVTNIRMVYDFNSDTSEMQARFEVYPKYGYYTGIGYAPQIAYSNNGMAHAFPNASTTSVKSDCMITSVYFLAYGDGLIPTGSIFEIWGVRA